MVSIIFQYGHVQIINEELYLLPKMIQIKYHGKFSAGYFTLAHFHLISFSGAAFFCLVKN